MKETYQEAITKVFEDEGGYSNDVGDPGGPTNWGITIHDARLYWKSTATSEDVKTMPKSVAEDIYRKHYAAPLCYDVLNPGVDYAVLDYGINSGIHRAAQVLQRLAGTTVDSVIGPNTVVAANKKDSKQLINQIYNERLAFLQSLSTWGTFGHGWTNRVNSGRALALSMVDKYKKGNATSTSVPIIVGGTAAATTAATASSHWWSHPWEIAAVVVGLGLVLGVVVHYVRKYVAINQTPTV